MSVTIYNRQGEAVFSTPINKGSKAKYTLMQEDYATLIFSVESPIRFNLGDYFNYSYNGKHIKRYEVIDLVNPKPNKNTGGYDYELRLDAYYWKWRNKIFKYYNDSTTTSKETSWNITATIDVIMGVFIRNLNDYNYKYYAGWNPYTFDLSTLENASEAKLVTFDNTNMIDALNAIAEAWEYEWWVTENIIHFGKCEYGDNYVPLHTLTHEQASANVDEMSQSGNRATYATRIFAYGSERNLPSNYRATDNTDVVNAVVQKRLMLPEDKPYIDAYRYVNGQRVNIGEEGYENGSEMPQEEAVEGGITLDKVYPRSTDTIIDIKADEITDTIENEDGTTTEEKWTRYRVKLSSSQNQTTWFKNKYILEGQTLRISFEDGLLNGMDFDVTFNPEGASESNVDSQWFEIVRNEEYGRKLPDDTLKPSLGDSVVLYNWDISAMMSDGLGYIADAEEELYTEAVKEIKKMMIDPNNYNCVMMSDVMLGYDLKTNTANPDNALTLDVGQRVLLINSAFFESGERKSRIIGYEYNLDLPWDSPTYTVGESVSVGRLSALESKVDNLTIKGIASTNTNKGGGSNIYIIGANDITKATDKNVYSALRSDKSFARKDVGDLIQDVWKFYKHIQSKDFDSGALGYGFWLGYDQYDENNNGTNSHLEVDTLKVRKKTMFDSLEIKHVSHVGGELILSPAGATISKVAEATSMYRCYFRNNDDTSEIVNQFAAGDLVMCKTFNLDGNQRYYWRTCTNVGKGSDGMAYIDLSKTMCDQTTTNDAPAEGDVIVTVGNSRYTARQNVIIISSYATGAPSISLYQGINNFTLSDDKMPVRISSTLGNKFTGEFYIQILADDGTKQVMALAEFLEERISLGVNHRLNGDNAVDKAAIGSANIIGLVSGGIYGRTYEVNEDVARTWKAGDEVCFSFLFEPHPDNDVTNLVIEGSGVLSYMFDSLDLSSAIRTGINKVSGTLICNKTLDDAIAEAESYDEEIAFGVTIRAKGMHYQGELTFTQGYSAELKRTGVDIERGYITLDAKTTTVKDGDKELAVFTTNDKGDAVLRTELIDAESIEANRLKTKGTVTDDGVNTNFVRIENNQIEVIDSNGETKLKVHSGTLASNSTTTTEIAYNATTATLAQSQNVIILPYTSRFRLANTNKLYKFAPISGNISLKLRQAESIYEPSGLPVLNVQALLYHSYDNQQSIDTMEMVAKLAEYNYRWSDDTSGTLTIPFDMAVDSRMLQIGFYILAVKISSDATHYDSGITLYGNTNGITGTQVTQMQEIAIDGYHYQYGDTTTPKYQKASADGFEVVYGNYGLRINASGVAITKNGGSTWTNL